MKENRRTRRNFIAGGAGAIAAVGLGALASTASSVETPGRRTEANGTANADRVSEKKTAEEQSSFSSSAGAKYAIITLDLKWNRDSEFRKVVAAVIPIAERHGVRLRRCWIAAIGQYRKVVSIWEADSDTVFLTAFADPRLSEYKDHFEALGSSTVDFATLLAEGPKKLSSKDRRGGVIVTGTVNIQPGQAAQFAKILVDSLPTMASHGVILEASFHTQVGNRNRVLDVWWAPNANAVYAALSDPVLDAPAQDLDYSSAMASELVEVSTELTFS